MLRFLKVVRSVFTTSWFAMKGQRHLSIMRRVTPVAPAIVEARSIAGYSVTIYAITTELRESYARWPRPRHHAVYLIYGVPSKDAPKLLHAACEFEITLPDLLPRSVSEAKRRESVISGYLDILIHRIESMKR